MKVVVATPFYEVKAYSPYITSLVSSIRALEQMRMDYDYYELSGDSYVDRAKNTLVHRFLQSDYTHIFMIDSDLAWSVDGFLKIIKAGMLGAEVVGGVYPNKNNWSSYGCIPMSKDGYFVGKEIGDSKYIKSYGIPGGFILYSREAFERARPALQVYTDPNINETFLECFRCNIEPHGGRIGEDIYFQARYRDCGGEVWLDPDISFIHFGVKGWEGNYHKYLMTTLGLPEGGATR